ncbi:hypothetical protein GCM10010174_62040 [Kutzneria viridogrisea]|uniref:DUF222 domain-containing protein n=1 Tax=Kutzneria viridogrisea TaxID=47990 RepID=A0ABR6BG84_9PSEU|nr:hypothetical protein [Kutzneria viridogrisea]
MTRLNQIIAIEKGIKGDTARRVTDLHHLVQRPAPLSGIARTYQPRDDDGDALPPESTQVQVRAHEVLAQAAAAMTRLFDVVATKDEANRSASADVLIDGETLLERVPVTTLLFLEKQLDDLRAFVGRLPVLDPAEEWVYDSARDCYATVPAKTTRTRKIPRNHVLAEATPQHPAQVQVWTEDVIVGTWTTTKLSGALPAARVAELVARVTQLREAVQVAREAANTSEVQDVQIGKAVFDFLLT